MSREGVRWEGGDWEFGGSLGDWEFRDSLGVRESRRLGESVSQGVYETGSL